MAVQILQRRGEEFNAVITKWLLPRVHMICKILSTKISSTTVIFRYLENVLDANIWYFTHTVDAVCISYDSYHSWRQRHRIRQVRTIAINIPVAWASITLSVSLSVFPSVTRIYCASMAKRVEILFWIETLGDTRRDAAFAKLLWPLWWLLRVLFIRMCWTFRRRFSEDNV